MTHAEYKVQLEIFEGPLDLLLYLIKKDEVDIQAISIERITRQYLEYLDTFKMLNIDLASEFIVMAANLMYLKSRTLLPKAEQPPEEDAEEDDPRWELIRQLIEYKKFKDAAGFLAMRAIEQEGRYAHQPDTGERPPEESPPLAEVSIFDLIRAFQNVLKRFEEAHDFGDIIDDRFTVADKIDFLMKGFAPGESRRFDELFQSATTKSEVIVTFLALLELMKLNQFVVRQDSLLAAIVIQRRDPVADAHANDTLPHEISTAGPHHAPAAHPSPPSPALAPPAATHPPTADMPQAAGAVDPNDTETADEDEEWEDEEDEEHEGDEDWEDEDEAEDEDEEDDEDEDEDDEDDEDEDEDEGDDEDEDEDEEDWDDEDEDFDEDDEGDRDEEASEQKSVPPTA